MTYSGALWIRSGFYDSIVIVYLSASSFVCNMCPSGCVAFLLCFILFQGSVGMPHGSGAMQQFLALLDITSLTCLSLFSNNVSLPELMPVYICVIFLLVCHFPDRSSEAHGAGGGTRRPRPGGSCCYSGRGRSRRRREVWGVWLQRSAQWPHLPWQEHPWLQA